MFRDFFTNKWVIGGVAFLIVLAVACVFWYRYDTAAARREAAETAELLRQWAAKKADTDSKGPVKPVESRTPTTENPTVEAVVKTDTSTEPETKTYKVGDIFIGPEPPPLPVSQNELVSPYGFGPYPELPEGFGPITWPRKSAESELLMRVRIKLLKQGIPIEGAVMKNDLVYPIIKGIRYVEWGETSYGRRYLRRSTGHPDDGDYMEPIEEERRKRRESVTASDFPGIQLIPYSESGIDPYTFLDLPK